MSSSQPVKEDSLLLDQLRVLLDPTRPSVRTGDPDVVQLCRRLRLLAGDGLEGQLQFFPMERIF